MTRIVLVATIVLSGAATAAAAAEWPTRPVKLVVPFSAAGTADLLGRLVADRLGAAFGQPFVVEHRPGAGGIIGQEQVARAAPDGYTFVVSSLGSFILSPVFAPTQPSPASGGGKGWGFDPFKDFTHIAYLGGQPVALFANKNLPYRTLGEMVAYAKPRPGALTYATIAIGSQTQLLNEQFQQQAGIKMTHVPYRGAGQIVTDVMGGHIPVGLTALAAIAGQVQAGSVRGLAIATEKRLPAYPDLPTYEEQGYPGLVASAWFALAAPAGLPRDIVVRVNAEVVKALHTPDLQARFAREAIDTKTLDADAFTAFFKAESERWTPLAKKVAEEMKAGGR